MQGVRVRCGAAWGVGGAIGIASVFFSSRRRHTRCSRDWSSDVCPSDQVRNQQQLPRVRGNSFLCMGVELEQRIEAHELNAAAVENLFARDARKDLLHHPLGSFVPVANWKFEKFAFSVNQSIINAPAI